MKSTKLHINALILSLTMLVSGCQCCGWTETYGNLIDGCSEHEGRCDACYHATWDISRMGRSDWCASPLNRKLVGDHCECYRRAPQPIYPQANPRTVVEPVAPAPPADAALPEEDYSPMPMLPPAPGETEAKPADAPTE